MPKSKRNKQVELAKTKKHGFENKKRLFEQIRSCVDSYANLFVFSVNDMRNAKMKNVREQWKHSRFFIGKNKVMSMALGRFPEEEYRPNLHKISQELKGQRGLLFSNQSVGEVLSWFRSYSEGDYARSGHIATENINLSEGPLPQFPHNLEPYLRQLGLPTSLVKGVVHLVKDHEVCKVGDKLTPETAKILKLLGYEMAEFHVKIDCVWSTDGSFMNFGSDSTTTNSKDAKGKVKRSQVKSTKVTDCEIEKCIMNILPNTMKSNEAVNNISQNISFDSENEEEKENTDTGSLNNEKNKSEFVSSNSNVIGIEPCESINQDKSEEMDDDQMDVDVISEKAFSVSESKHAASTPKEKHPRDQNPQRTEGSSPKINASPKNDIEAIEIEEVIEIDPKINVSPKSVAVTEAEATEVINEATAEVKNEENANSDDNVTVIQNEIKNTAKDPLSEDNGKVTDIGENNTRKSRAQKRKGNNQGSLNEILKNEEEAKKEKISRPSRALKKTVSDKKIEKETPLKKEADLANSSQDSPAFRELRNRSIKVSKKKKK